MKLIVDAQLPVKLCEVLNQLGFESIHVDELPKGDETPDLEISEIADRENLIVLTKDYDYIKLRFRFELSNFMQESKIT